MTCMVFLGGLHYACPYCTPQEHLEGWFTVTLFTLLSGEEVYSLQRVPVDKTSRHDNKCKNKISKQNNISYGTLMHLTFLQHKLPMYMNTCT
jgi:hypothetical protein